MRPCDLPVWALSNKQLDNDGLAFTSICHIRLVQCLSLSSIVCTSVSDASKVAVHARNGEVAATTDITDLKEVRGHHSFPKCDGQINQDDRKRHGETFQGSASVLVLTFWKGQIGNCIFFSKLGPVLVPVLLPMLTFCR